MLLARPGSLARYVSMRRARPILHLALALALGALLLILPLWTAAALLLLGGILILFLRWPLLGLGLLLIAAPWGALENNLLGSGYLESGQLLFFLLVAVWLARGVVRRRIVLPQTPLNLPLALFIGVAALSLLNWPGREQAPDLVAGLTELLKWLEMLLLMWLVVDLAGGDALVAKERGASLGAQRRRLLPLLALFLLPGFVEVLVGIWQFAFWETAPEHFLILGRFYRAYGTFEQPNPYGGFLAWSALLALGATVGLLMAWLARRRSAARRPSGWLLFFAASTAFLGFGLLISWSRGAWLGFAAGLAAFLFFWPRRRWLGLALLALAAFALLLAWQADVIPAPLAARLSSFTNDLRLADVRGAQITDANYAVLERLAHWQSAVDMARDNLWLGVGFGNYENAYAGYALLNWPNALGHAHNYYLNLLAETGLLGLAAYFVFWAVVFGQTLWLLPRLPWPERGLALGLLAVWTALTVHHLLDNLYVNNLFLHLGAMLGILQLLQRQASPLPLSLGAQQD